MTKTAASKEGSVVMKRLPNVSVVLASCALLAACGGGGGGGGGTTTPIPDYIEFTDSSTSADSELGGRAIVSNTAEIRELSGTLTHNTRALTDLTDGTRTLTDADGDTGGVWTDGTTTAQPLAAQVGSYDFVAFYEFSGATEGGPMVIGVTIDSADVPTMGTVDYTGEAFIEGTSASGSVLLTATGNSTVSVDFENSLVDLTIDGLAGAGSSQYDELQIIGMVFSGDRTAFSGGTLTLSQSAADVTGTLLGGDAAGTAFGDFFGIDGSDNPDEVGGLFENSGSAGELAGGFIAD